MPNNISNTIIFDAVHADKVFAECCPDRELDFNTLIPVPLYIYQGELEWNCKHWGTKWNAYDSICSIHGDKAYICFNTAWSIPRPIIIAFANKFGSHLSINT